MKNSVLYLGNFSPITSFAALNRALGICKLFNGINFDSHIAVHDCNESFFKNSYFQKNNITLHVTNFKKQSFYYSSKEYFNLIKKIPNLRIVILYNFPFIPSKKIIKYCSNNGIKVIGDITEWYDTSNVNLILKPIKYFDTESRMKKLNYNLDGLILVSNYLNSFYKRANKIKIYPLMDYAISDSFYSHTKTEDKNSLIRIGYVGISGNNKDDLEGFLDFLSRSKITNVEIIVVGTLNDKIKRSLKKSGIPFKYYGLVDHSRAIELLCGCDCQVLFRKPSRMNNAGFPTKFAESTCLGIPVICTRFSDLADFVSETTFVIDNNPDELKHFLLSIKKKLLIPDCSMFYAKYYEKEFAVFIERLLLKK